MGVVVIGVNGEGNASLLLVARVTLDNWTSFECPTTAPQCIVQTGRDKPLHAETAHIAESSGRAIGPTVHKDRSPQYIVR
jgi:hypothetical protein